MRDHRSSYPFIAIVAIAAALSACQKVPMLPGISPYRIDIQQGNVVTQDMIDKLKPGMTRQQVRFVMGTPPIVDPFHKDRWDYVYYLNRAGRVAEHRRLVLLFDGEILKRVEGDVVVGTSDKGAKPAGAASGAAKPRETTVPDSQPQTAKPRETTTIPQPQSAKPSETPVTDPQAQSAKPGETTTATDAQAQTQKPSETRTTDTQSQTVKPTESTASPQPAAAATDAESQAVNPRETTAADSQPQTEKQATP